jgi:hypothetical protein
MDTDGNGLMSKDEMRAVCVSALKQYRSKEDDPIIDSLTDYFVKAVFESVGANFGEEIPISQLTELVDDGVEAMDILLQFLGAEQMQDEETILENNCLDFKIPKFGSSTQGI